MSIIEKYRMITRYGVAVFLAAAACFSGYAGCTYEREERNGQWGWRVRCSFGSDEFFPDEEGGGGEGGGGGSCSNCVSMTPAACAQAQADIKSTAERLGNEIDVQLVRLSSANDYLNTVQGKISAIKNEGEQFQFYSAGSSIPGSSQTEKIDYLTSVNPYIGYTLYSSTFVNSSYKVTGVMNANNGIYNYYNDGIVPLLTDIDNGVAMAYTYVNDSMSDLEDLKLVTTEFDNIANNMNCDACSSSGGGGGSGSGTTDSSGCPCASYIVAVQGAVDNVQLKLSEVKTLMDNWNLKFQKWDNLLKSIADAVGPIGTNFVHAVELTDLDGTAINMAELDKLLHDQSTGAFDQGEYAKLSWFTRVEYLLGQIAGVFSVTNRDEDLEEDSITDAYDSILSDKDSLSSSVNQVKNQFSNIHTSFNGFFSSFRSAYAGLGSSATTITLCSSWFGGRGLTFQVDGSVRQVARTISSLMWTLNFTFLAYNILIYGIKYFAFVFKLWLSQITQFVK